MLGWKRDGKTEGYFSDDADVQYRQFTSEYRFQ